MKNTNYIINGVLAVAVIILFVLYFTSKKNSSDKEATTSPDSTYTKLPIAYVNSDSLISHYNYAKDLNEGMMRKAESSRTAINQRTAQLQKEFMQFQQTKSVNAFLSTDREKAEAERLTRKQQDLEEFAGHMQEEFAAEQAKINQQLTDTVVAAIKIYNQSKKYQIIFSNTMRTGTILYAADAYDITNEVIEFLNKRYVPAEK